MAAGKVRYGSLPFNQQIAYFRNKTNIGIQRWSDIWQQAHDRSFMVAGAMKDDLLADFRHAVDTAISEGRSLSWFQSQFNSVVAKHGWQHNGSANWRSQVIYDTNIRQSYTAGREQQIEQIKHRRPYGIYKHSGSEHPRHDHLSWHNRVLLLDDPWWQTHTPINGYGCQCKKMTASERDLQRLGLTVSPSPKVEYYHWADKTTGEVHRIPKGIDPGFDYTPKSSAELTQKTKAAIARKPPLNERLTPRVVDSAFSTVKGINAQSLSHILSQLDSPQVGLLANIIDRHQLKTLFIKQGEMAGKQKSRALAMSIEAYLQSGRSYPMSLFTHPTPTRVGGFTSRSWQHVVVKAKSTDSLKRVDINAISQTLEQMLHNQTTPFTCSSLIDQTLGSVPKIVTTWLHEMGHQVYYKAGMPTLLRQPALTTYSKVNQHEWFAEHFVLWMLAPEQLNLIYPDIFEQITDIVYKAM